MEAEQRAGKVCTDDAKAIAASETKELLKGQHEALLQVLESWLSSQEERLTGFLERRIGMGSQPAQQDSEIEMCGAMTETYSSGWANGTGDISDSLDKDLFRSSRPQSTDAYTPRKHDNFARVLPRALPSHVRERLQESAKEEKERFVDRYTVMSVCKAIVQHPAFEMSFASLIFFNAIIIFLDVHLSLESPTGEPPAVLAPIGHLMGVLFLMELLLRAAADGGRAFFLGGNWGWNLFDLCLVVFWLVEFILDLRQATSQSSSSASSDSAGVSSTRPFRVLRIAKMVRLLRIARVLRFVRALNLLIFSILTTLRSLVWASTLLLLIIFTFAICICQSVADVVRSCNAEACTMDPDLKRYWGTVPAASLSLFQVITGGKDWDDVATPLADLSGFLLLVLLIFIVFAQFAVLNVVTGVFCQAAVESAQKDREFMVQNIMTNKKRFMTAIGDQFNNMFKRFPASKGGITAEIFAEQLNGDGVQEYFALLDLDGSDAWMLFQLLDEDGSGTIDVEEFVEGCLRLKGSARGIDLAKLSKDFKHIGQQLSDELANVKNQLGAVLNLVEQGPGQRAALRTGSQRSHAVHDLVEQSPVERAATWTGSPRSHPAQQAATWTGSLPRRYAAPAHAAPALPGMLSALPSSPRLTTLQQIC
eukprot:TRINITY_DN39879_c0_g3_i1.p1 TRINITY_DN39879_c0_g3~~TRINITY_DN39879_c0_g3_i1.p1  ORF type:complete len:670 (-),score=121.30 TRINITY_DN39879_c0_g3_i1:768-2714(-)